MLTMAGDIQGKGALGSRAMIKVIGIGNSHRRDDGVGLEIAKRLREQAGKTIEVIEAGGEVAALIDAWQGADTVIVFDAVLSGGEPGEIYRIDAVAHPVPARFGLCSSHSMGLAQAVELSRAMGRLPRRLVIYGVEGADFGMGTGLTPEVEKSAHKLTHSMLVAVQAAEHLAEEKQQNARN